MVFFSVFDFVLLSVTFRRKLSLRSTARRIAASLTKPMSRIPIEMGGGRISLVPSSLVISLQQTPDEPWPREQSFELASTGESCEAH